MIDKTNMNTITRETRRESHELVKPTKNIRYTQILEVMGGGSYTVDEVIDLMMERRYLTYPDRNSVAPRLTELSQTGKVRVVGKRTSGKTGKTVSVYRAV